MLPRLGVLLILITGASACGDQVGPEFEADLLGHWEGSFRGVVAGVAIRLDLTQVRDGVIEGTGQLGYTGTSVTLPLTGTYDPPLLQIVLTGEEDAFFSMITELDGAGMSGTALSTFSTRVLPGGSGQVSLTRRAPAASGGSE